MPEGPEVTKITNQLNEKLKGKVFQRINILSGRYIKTLPIGFENFHHYVNNVQPVLRGVKNKGKFIWWDFGPDNIVFSTLGMTGCYKTEADKYARVQWVYNNTESIYYCDMRNFGTLKFTNDVELTKKLKELGPDMLNDPCSLEDFVKICRKKKTKSIVSFLLDQKAISGIGNIYKSEALYLAGISPYKKVEDLTPKELRDLYLAIDVVLSSAYLLGGSTIANYADTDNQVGKYFNKKAVPIEIERVRKAKITDVMFSSTVEYFLSGHMVYQAKKDPFGNEVRKATLDDGRTTWYVPEVQL